MIIPDTIALMQFLETIKKTIKGVMKEIAITLDDVSNGAIKPIHVTLFSFIGHIVILSAILVEAYPQAALLLVVFGLMDSLDGALARVQKRESDSGVLLDSSLDRVKEVLIYMGLAYVLALNYDPIWAMWAVAALGGSMAVSYFKAKGEAIVASKNKYSASELNQLFRSGLMGYEIRMSILVLGLLVDEIQITVAVIAVLSWLTALTRLIQINNTLR